MKWITKHLARLRDLQDDPRKIALGIALGTFIGFFPPLGLKTLLAIGLTRLFRGNVIASAIAVSLHDLLLPIAPFLLKWEFQVGNAVLGGTSILPLPTELHRGALEAWLHWSTLLRLESPLLTGGMIIGAPFGVAAYFLALSFLRSSRAKRSA